MLNKKPWLIFLGFLVLSGCAVIATTDFTALYGESYPRERVVAELPAGEIDYWQSVKPVLNNRCVVCHGCYDAACQLKLTAIEGITRGADEKSVYSASRLTRANLTRLFEDGHDVAQWRDHGFFPVLNEYEQSPEANKQAGLMYQMLQLKELHPLPEEKVLDNDDFTFGITRSETCPKIETFERYAKKTPLWGMPYALPQLADNEQAILKGWLEAGARYTKRPPLPLKFNASIENWESILNQNSLKGQLISRYIYEHLFLAHLYFDDISNSTFFKLVRSSTPPGVPVQIIATRRPYDDPEVDRVYYRLIPELETIVHKSHLPYALNQARKERWNSLFFDMPFEVDLFPSYNAELAGNPFVVFSQLPMTSRYKFMLDEAQFTIMNYIKGPVCRGNAAVNAINDRFWVFFLDPNLPINNAISTSIAGNAENLELPSTLKDDYLPLLSWRKHAKKELENRERGDAFVAKQFKEGGAVFDLSLIWDGTDPSSSVAYNKNAALTVFRHKDTATVEQGLIGDDPKTAWVIAYPLLERIHYLLVAGYDVYGNVSHQLLSRLYMDFLRMNGELSFLWWLPQPERDQERDFWYRGASKHVLEYLSDPAFEHLIPPAIDYKTNNPKKELFALLKQRLGPSLSNKYSLNEITDASLKQELKRLSHFSGKDTNLLAEATMVEIVDSQKGVSEFITILRNNGHLNITAILRESKTLLPEENTITVVKGFLGAYPNAFMKVKREDITLFVDEVLAMNSNGAYRRLLDQFGMRRTNQDFWRYSDNLHNKFRLDSEVNFGFLDYNRLENR